MEATISLITKSFIGPKDEHGKFAIHEAMENIVIPKIYTVGDLITSSEALGGITHYFAIYMGNNSEDNAPWIIRGISQTDTNNERVRLLQAIDQYYCK